MATVSFPPLGCPMRLMKRLHCIRLPPTPFPLFSLVPVDLLPPFAQFLIPITGLAEITDGPFAGHRWADPLPGALADILRRVAVDDREGARAVGLEARKTMVERYSLAAVAEIVVGLVDAIVDDIAP